MNSKPKLESTAARCWNLICRAYWERSRLWSSKHLTAQPKGTCDFNCARARKCRPRVRNGNYYHDYRQRRNTRGQRRGHRCGSAPRTRTERRPRGHRAKSGNSAAAEMARNAHRPWRSLRTRSVCRRRLRHVFGIRIRSFGSSSSDSLQQVAHFAFLGFEVAARDSRDARLAGDALDDLNSRAFELADFFRIVRKQTDFFRAECFQDLRGEIVITRIGGETECFVGFHGVHSAVLQFVRAELVHQADAAAFLRKINQNSRRRLPDFLQRQFELRAAIASQRGKHIPSQALRVHAHQWRGPAFQISAYQRNRFFPRPAALESENGETAVARRQLGVRDHLDRRGTFLQSFALV